MYCLNICQVTYCKGKHESVISSSPLHFIFLYFFSLFFFIFFPYYFLSHFLIVSGIMTYKLWPTIKYGVSRHPQAMDLEILWFFTFYFSLFFFFIFLYFFSFLFFVSFSHCLRHHHLQIVAHNKVWCVPVIPRQWIWIWKSYGLINKTLLQVTLIEANITTP